MDDIRPPDHRPDRGVVARTADQRVVAAVAIEPSSPPHAVERVVEIAADQRLRRIRAGAVDRGVGQLARRPHSWCRIMPSANGAPTMMSREPSPLTSPAEADRATGAVEPRTPLSAKPLVPSSSDRSDVAGKAGSLAEHHIGRAGIGPSDRRHRRRRSGRQSRRR